MNETKPTILSRRILYEGWNRLHEVVVSGRTGEHKREIVDHGDAASILPYDPERRTCLLVRQLRAPLLVRGGGDDGWLLEACAGIIDPGETPQEAALREAREELGLALSAAEPVASVYAAPGCLKELSHLFLAPYRPADRAGEGGGNHHEGEEIEVIELCLHELYAMVGEARIADAKTLILVQTLMLRGI
ncbi:NUDIX domain-containing protein [Afifella pfennigii]|uniref:NUDIX domain-containing protein n=1 Tax=Afifella pfennigii TaxID=209897 RepID=UPI000553CB4A|nr:NUDIX domain-containing protein [Afifella pfennigii]